MVNMSVREQHEVEGLWIKTKRPSVACRCLMSTLKHAAVHQETNSARLDQVTRTRDLTSCTKKGDFHDLLPFAVKTDTRQGARLPPIPDRDIGMEPNCCLL